MISLTQLVPLVFAQNVGPQELSRTPEPERQVVTQDPTSVAQYDQVLETKLAISYAVATEAIYRTRVRPIKKAVDIACGPGHLSINMTRDLNIDELVGIDLSSSMIETARENAKSRNELRARFRHGNATELDIESSTLDLCTMMDAAHHLPSLEVVTQALSEMDRVTKPDGHIVVMDLVRLRTAAITDTYVQIVGDEYHETGLSDFYQQFRDSMYAAWTRQELASAVPADTNRKWVSLVPRGLPFAQFLFGVPSKQPRVFQRNGSPWEQAPVRVADTSEYRLASLGLGLASRHTIA